MSNVIKDSEGNEWSLGLTPVILENLAALRAVEPDQAIEKVLMPFLTGTEDDLGVTYSWDILWAMLSRQAEKKGIDKESFYAICFMNDAEKFYLAMTSALTNFCHPQKRGMILMTLQHANAQFKKAEAALEKTLEGDPRLGIDETQLEKRIKALVEDHLPSQEGLTANASSGEES